MPFRVIWSSRRVWKDSVREERKSIPFSKCAAVTSAITNLMSAQDQPEVVSDIGAERVATKARVRVILECVVFLHDAIGVGLFVCKISSFWRQGLESIILPITLALDWQAWSTPSVVFCIATQW